MQKSDEKRSHDMKLKPGMQVSRVWKVIFGLNTLFAVGVAGKELVSAAYFSVVLWFALFCITVNLVLYKHPRFQAAMRRQEKAYQMAYTDELTGLYNYRAYLKMVKEVSSYVILLVDVDCFKKVNDTYGHSFGDRVLRELARDLRSNIRDRDLAFRYGGEEFLVLLPDTSISQGMQIAERLRQAVEKEEFSVADLPVRITVSVGVSVKKGDVADQLIFEQADQALYSAKRQGRNRVRLLEHLGDSERLADLG